MRREIIEDIQRRASDSIALAQWDQALTTLRPILCLSVLEPRTALLYIQILVGLERRAEALNFAKKSSQLFPSHLPIIKEKAHLYLELGHHRDAVRCFNACQFLLKREEDVFQYGASLFGAGRRDEAFAVIRPLLSKTRYGPLLALAGDYAMGLKRFDIAADYFNSAVQNGFSNHRLYLRLGLCLQRLGQTRRAELIYRQLLDHDSSDVLATLSLSQCFTMRGDFERGLMICQSGDAWDVENLHLLSEAGYAAVQTGKAAFAEACFKRAMQQGEISAKAWAHLAFAAIQQKNWQEAEFIYFQMVQRFPEHVAGYRGLAWLFAVGVSSTIDTKSGLDAAERSVELLSDLYGWELLGACEARAGNFERAQSIQESLLAQPSSRSEKSRMRHMLKSFKRHLPLDANLLFADLVA